MQYHKERVKKEVLKGKTNSRDQILSLLDLAGRGQCERSMWVLDPEFGRWGGGEAVPVPGSWERGVLLWALPPQLCASEARPGS